MGVTPRTRRVSSLHARHITTLVSIWVSPRWANGGHAQNFMPTGQSALRVWQQPGATMLIWFLVTDEPRLIGWQSGFFTVNGGRTHCSACIAGVGAARGARVSAERSVSL